MSCAMRRERTQSLHTERAFVAKKNGLCITRMQTESLKNPWVFASASSLMIAAVTYVWSYLQNETDPGKKAVSAFAAAIACLMFATWIVFGGDSSVLQEPFPVT